MFLFPETGMTDISPENWLRKFQIRPSLLANDLDKGMNQFIPMHCPLTSYDDKFVDREKSRKLSSWKKLLS